MRVVTLPKTHSPRGGPGRLGGPAGFIGIPLGGAAAGALLAFITAPSSDAALAVCALALPLGFLLSLGAWRSLLGVWLAAMIGRSALRSRGNEERFRAETMRAFGSVRDAGMTRLPFTWVFVPVCGAVGAIAALLLLVVPQDGAPATAVLMLAAAIAFGIWLRRLARGGQFPIPTE